MAGPITRERIIALQAAYARCIDSDALEQWPDFFVEDCLYIVTTAENERQGFEAGIIYADTRGMLADRILALRRANVYEKHAYRHILGLPHVTRETADTTDAETSFLVLRIMHDGRTDIFASGVYLDTYRVTDGDVKVASRRVICDSANVDTLMALPV